MHAWMSLVAMPLQWHQSQLYVNLKTFSEPVPEPSASLPFWSSLTSSPRQQDRVTFPSTIYHTSHMYSQIFEAGLGVEHCEFKIHSAQKKKKIAFKAKSSLSRNV